MLFVIAHGRTEAFDAELAHEINNPRQSLTNLLYLAETDGDGQRELATKLEGDFRRLSELVKNLLGLPVAFASRGLNELLDCEEPDRGRALVFWSRTLSEED